MRIVITGSTSYLGYFFLRRARAGGCDVLAITRRPAAGYNTLLNREIPLSDDCRFDSEAVRRFAPSAIVHLAAISSPEKCEQEPERARLVNVEFTSALAALADEIGCSLLFTSSDLVFDGALAPAGGFDEHAEPAPRSVYARGKLEGERVVLTCASGIVARLSLLYGPPAPAKGGPLAWMVRNFSNSAPVPLFSDEWRTPIYVDDAARALLEILHNRPRGVLHLAGPERTNRLEFGRRLARMMGFDERLILEKKRADAPSNPPRPEDVSLNSSRLGRLISFVPDDISTGLSRTASEIALNPFPV